MTILIPDGLEMAPQEWRCFEAMQDWAKVSDLQKAINDPDGTPRWTHPRVIVSKIRRKLEPFRLTVETRMLVHSGRGRKPVEYRIAPLQTAEEAA